MLEPGDTDDAAIARRLNDVRALWDKRREHAKYGQMIRTLSDAHLEAEITLGDPGERSRVAKEAAERDRERTDKADRALASWRSVLADTVKASGGLDPARRGNLE